MSIHLNNYEEWMIDYLEGNLNDHQSKEVEAFLLKHPHIAEEMDMLLETPLIPPDNIKLPDEISESLKQNEIKAFSQISEENYKNWFVAFHEGDLEEGEKTKLDHFLSKNEFLRAELESFSKTKLQADIRITYPYKNTLLKKEKPIIPLWAWPSVAAAILVIGFWMLSPNQSSQSFEPPQKISSKFLAKLEFSEKTTTLSNPATPLMASLPSESFFMEPESQIPEIQQMTEALGTPVIMASRDIHPISVEENEWKIQMELMQGFAFGRNQLFSKVDWSSLPSENSKSGFRIISSFLWKTTKTSVQNISEDVFQNELQALSSSNLESITGGLISVKRPAKEME